MLTPWQRIWQNPKSTARGFLVLVITIATALGISSAVSPKVAGICIVIAGIAHQLIEAYSLDAGTAQAAVAAQVDLNRKAMDVNANQAINDGKGPTP